MLNNLSQIHFKTASEGAIQKAVEATRDLIGNKIADKITKVSGTSPQNTSKKVANKVENIEHNNKIT